MKSRLPRSPSFSRACMNIRSPLQLIRELLLSSLRNCRIAASSTCITTPAQWALPPSMSRLEARTFGLPILSLAEVGTTVSADHLLQMATMPLEHKTTALGIPYPLQVSHQFDGTDELTQSLHSLFGLLVMGNTPRYCPQASRFGKDLCCCSHT